MAVTVAIVKVGEENTLIKQVYADGRTVFTLIENGSVAAELIAGAKARAGNVGFDATASASAGGQLEGARTYTFTDPEEAKKFEDMVREHGSFGQVLRNAAEGWDPLGVKDWTLDHVFGDDVDMEDLPEPDSTYLGVDAFITGEAAAIGNVILADAGASALLKYSGGARAVHERPAGGHRGAQHEARRRARRPARPCDLRPEHRGQGELHGPGHARPEARLPPVAHARDRHGRLQRRPGRLRLRA